MAAVMAVTAVEWVPPILFLKVLLALKYSHAEADGSRDTGGGASAAEGTREQGSAAQGLDTCAGGSSEGEGGWKQKWRCMMRMPSSTSLAGSESVPILPFV